MIGLQYLADLDFNLDVLSFPGREHHAVFWILFWLIIVSDSSHLSSSALQLFSLFIIRFSYEDIWMNGTLDQ